MLLALEIIAYFYNFAAINIVEVDEDRRLVDCEHEVSAEGFEWDE